MQYSKQVAFGLGVWEFSDLRFAVSEFVSDFELRISDFV